MGLIYTFIGEVPVVVLPAESLIDIPSRLQTLCRRKEGGKEGREVRREGERNKPVLGYTPINTPQSVLKILLKPMI